MKKLLLLIACAVMYCIAYGQSAKEMLAEIDGKWELDDNNNVTFVRIIEVPELSAEDIYNRALVFFSYNYVSGESVIQVQDKENGLIVGKGIFIQVHRGMSISDTFIDATHIMRIDAKDGRARIIGTLQEYKIKTVTYGPPTYSTCLISSRYPIANQDMQKTVMSKAFYKSYHKILDTFDNLEKSIKEGNTSAHIENSDW